MTIKPIDEIYFRSRDIDHNRAYEVSSSLARRRYSRKSDRPNYQTKLVVDAEDLAIRGRF